MYAAYRLLEALNEGRKEKEMYRPEWWYKEGDKYIFMAAVNRNHQPVFNVLNDQGEIPEGFAVNWRSIDHVKHELKIYNQPMK